MDPEAVYVGIDPTAGRRPFHYAVLDGDLKVARIDQGDAKIVLDFLRPIQQVIVAIDSPQSPNQRLMKRPDVRRRYGLPLKGDRWGQWKVCEYELRRRNIRLYNTPSRQEDAPKWMRHGFELYQQLKAMGFRFFSKGAPLEGRTLLEVHPHACFSTLLGRRPFLKTTIEGRLQRQLLLYLEGVDVRNPMHALEEITKHHLLSGELPLEDLLDHDALDALVGAFTAYLAGTKPGRTCQVGDLGEGFITLPVGEVKDFYP